MLEQQSQAIEFYAHYTDGGAGKTGLTVTCTVYGPGHTSLATAQAATELGNGLYYYALSSANTATAGAYTAVFSTASTAVDQKDIPAFWAIGTAGIENLDSPISDIAITGGAINAAASSRTLTTGTETGTYLNTEARDGAYHQIADATGTISLYYEFIIQAEAVPTQITFYGRINGVGDDITVQAYNWAGVAFDSIGTLVGTAQTTDAQHQYTLFPKHVGTGTDAGKIRIGFSGTGLTTASLYIDQLYVSYAVVYRTVGYADGAVWLDTNNGTAGTELFLNGTADNPVDTIADALTIAGNLGLTAIHIASGSSVTFAAAASNLMLWGSGWSLDLGGQTLTGIDIYGATVTGTQIGGGGLKFHDCTFGTASAGVSLLDHVADDCDIFASGAYAITIGAGVTIWKNCVSAVAGNDTPRMIFGANCDFNCRAYYGGLQIEQMDATNLASFDCPTGQLKIAADCTGGTLRRAGLNRLTDNSGGAVTITDGYGMTLETDADGYAVLPDLTTLLTRLTTARAANLDLIDVANSTLATPADLAALALEATLQDVVTSTDTLLTRLSADKSNRLLYLDVSVSSRLAASNYIAPPSLDSVALEASVQTLLARLTAEKSGFLDVAISSRLANTDYTAPYDISGLATATQASDIISSVDLRLLASEYEAPPPAISGFATSTQAEAIKAKTDLLPPDPAGVADLTIISVDIDPALLNIDLSGVASVTQAQEILDWQTTTRGGIIDGIPSDVAVITGGIDAIYDDMATDTQGQYLVGWHTATRGADFDTLSAGQDQILTVLGEGGGRPLVVETVDAADGITPVPLVEITVRNLSGGLIAKFQTDANGQAVRALPDGQYEISFFSRAWDFPTIPLTVDGEAISATWSGTRRDLALDPPDDPETCRIYAYLSEQAGYQIPAEVEAFRLKITSLPYNVGGRYFIGQEMGPQYDPSTGTVYWDVVWGATVSYKLPAWGISKAGIVPSAATLHIEDWPE